MHNGLTVVAWQLANIEEGDGGLCVVPGSHKGNYPCPQGLRCYEDYREYVKQITCRAGDVIIFTEALSSAAGSARVRGLVRYCRRAEGHVLTRRCA